MEKGLIELGAAPVTADEIRWAYAAMRNRNILKFYEDYAYAGSHREWQKLLAAYIERSVSFYVQRFAPPAAKGITEGCRVRVTLPGPTEGKEGTATWDASASKWEVRFDPTEMRGVPRTFSAGEDVKKTGLRLSQSLSRHRALT